MWILTRQVRSQWVNDARYTPATDTCVDMCVYVSKYFCHMLYIQPKEFDQRRCNFRFLGARFTHNTWFCTCHLMDICVAYVNYKSVIVMTFCTCHSSPAVICLYACAKFVTIWQRGLATKPSCRWISIWGRNVVSETLFQPLVKIIPVISVIVTGISVKWEIHVWVGNWYRRKSDKKGEVISMA